MSQGILGFKYEEEKHETGMTGLAGLPVYMDLIKAMGLSELIGKHLQIKNRGWTDAQTIISLMLMNIAGGDCVEDLSKLEKDEGFCSILRRVEHQGKPRSERRAIERRWHKESKRSVPSPSSVFRYLSSFHNKEQEENRVTGKAFIPEPNEHLQAMAKICQGMAAFIQKRDTQKIATLDQDATLVETFKQNALFCYKGFSSYQPLNTWWSEQQIILHTEFRDGNVPAGYEQLRVLQEALSMLPEGVMQVRLRSDTAGYQHSLLQYCEKGENRRFGRIEFAVGADVTPEFKKAVMREVSKEDWQPIYKEFDGRKFKTNQEWAEVCFVPNAISQHKDNRLYRYLAIREPIGSMELPQMPQQVLPFPTMEIELQRYKLFGMVTNMDWSGDSLINWHRERCGKSEEAHSIMKGDFAGGKLPSGDFGENAAWWWIMILAMNLNTMMKRLVMGESWASRRMKAIRFSFINIPGRILDQSRELIIRLAKGHPAMAFYLEARRRIMELIPATG
jgi:hypothetical protein